MKAFHKDKLTHGDFHLNNIGDIYTDASKRSMKLMPIDFGRSHIEKAYASLEIGGLIRTLNPTCRVGFHKEPGMFLSNTSANSPWPK